MPDVDAKKANLDELIDDLSARLISEPIEWEDKIIIPIGKFSMGFGTNMGRTGPHVSQEDPDKCAVGGGVGLFPVAVVIVFKGISGPQGVKVVALP